MLLKFLVYLYLLKLLPQFVQLLVLLNQLNVDLLWALLFFVQLFNEVFYPLLKLGLWLPSVFQFTRSLGQLFSQPFLLLFVFLPDFLDHFTRFQQFLFCLLQLLLPRIYLFVQSLLSSLNSLILLSQLIFEYWILIFKHFKTFLDMFEFPGERCFLPFLDTVVGRVKLVKVGFGGKISQFAITVNVNIFLQRFDMLVQLLNILLKPANDFIFFPGFLNADRKLAFHFHENCIFTVDPFQYFCLFVFVL